MSENKDIWYKLEVIGKILAGILMPLVIFIIGTNINVQQVRKEQEQKDIDRISSIIKSLSSENKRERILTIEFAKHLAQTKQFPEELFPVFLNVINSETDLNVVNEANEVLKVVAKTNLELSKEIEKIKSDKTSVVYIQYRNSNSRDKATELQEVLLRAGYKVPGIEHVKNAYLVGSDIRFFNNNREERDVAQKIADLIRPVSGDVKIHDLSGKYTKHIKPFIFEIWIE